MKTYLALEEGSVVESSPAVANFWIYSDPDDAEKRELLDSLRIDEHALESALDPDEVSRVEFPPDHAFVIWKRPSMESSPQQFSFEVSSVGIFLNPRRLTMILGKGDPPSFTSKEFQSVGSLNDLTLRFLLSSTRHYFEHLKVIKQLTRELQAKLNTSLENQYLLQMFALAESLTYYLNAIEANAAVLSRLRAHSETIGFSERELEILDDLSIEHQQCYKQTEITSSVLSTLMDARGTLVNNNMNVLLKNLTIINVIFLPLNLLASIGGMSEFTDMTRNVDWKVSYSLLIVAMGGLGWLTWRYLVSRIDRWVARAGR